MSERVLFNWRAPHHGYMGALLILFAWLMQPHELYDTVTPLFYVVGGLVLLDDVVEHSVYGNTPLRILFVKVIVPVLKKIS